MIKNYALIEGSIVKNIAVINDENTEVLASLNAVEIPAGVSVNAGWLYSGGVFTFNVIETRTLAEVQEKQLNVIEAAYKSANTQPISYMATTFQADAESQSLMASVITACGGSLPAGFAWFDTGNSPVTMTFAQLQGLAGSILLRGQPLFVTKQIKKAAIRAATTIQQVEAVTWI